MKDNILAEYDKNKNGYKKFTQSLQSLLNEILIDFSLVTIDVRLKDKESLKKKIELKEKYSSIEDITDIIGARIITYLPDKVDEIANKLKNEFNEDVDKSVDKRKKGEDSFGYMSLHLIMNLNQERRDLTEYKQFKNINFEIQIRTILQHSWAEIEHDLGYKSEIDIPSDIKRRFLRLASILELADEEFQSISEEVEKYRKEIRNEITKSKDIELNKNSIEEYLKTSLNARQIFNDICEKTDAGKVEGIYITSILIKKLKFLGYTSIKEIDNALKNNNIVEFAIYFLEEHDKIIEKERSSKNFNMAVSLFYLCYLELCKKDKKVQGDYLKKFTSNNETISRILTRVCKKIEN